MCRPRAPAALVVIDQAYAEFGGTDLSHLVREREDIVVVRTLSKAFALAGGPGRLHPRAAEPVARALEAVRPPGSISSHANALALRGAGRAATRCARTWRPTRWPSASG